MARPRIVFMGTPAFAVPSLEACLELADVVAVVTQPDKPKGRGQEVQPPPVKVRALEAGVPVLQPSKLRGTGFADELRALTPDVCVVTAYGKILPRDVLTVSPLGCVNVHGSLLPRFRGAAPIQRALAAGDSETGVCLMQMDEGMDTGPVLAVKHLQIRPTDTSASLHDALSVLGGQVLREELPRYLAGTLQAVPQPSEGVVMAPMIDKEEGRLDFTRPAVELERRLRAFTPWPGAFTTLEGQLLKVHALEVGEGKGDPGEVLRADADGVEVACGVGSVRLLELQAEGKRRMTARDFLAGRKIQPGTRPFGAGPEGAP